MVERNASQIHAGCRETNFLLTVWYCVKQLCIKIILTWCITVAVVVDYPKDEPTPPKLFDSFPHCLHTSLYIMG